MQTTRREIDSFVSRKSFKYNDVIDSKIVNLDIWCHFQFLDESSRELKSSIDSRSISDQVRMLKSSIRVESEDWYRVLESSQKIYIKTRLNNQSMNEQNSLRNKIAHQLHSDFTSSKQWILRQCIK